ncbi:Uncharacterised protein [Chryseobacterium gleum]|uniref:Uncharacterized protein n=2 Tax=Chryseobacterium gleum TaxID=250 RepID=A0A3S4R625_CHRGE|nr:hypothetical protein [Chryseobacterium gleum]EFK36066.1 hypothetical protein HMPREF0204_15135 [Chryseobacterium gleum ATCC 35910]QQY31768.1 hypothetical protein I6I60_23465 [Chryseobacterium gleum]VEE11196.1 Uncharacterised protein [Chryseobacterium gleum]VFA44008.1 Uncharacterised protein [Chryseobacterium indologenes]
MKDQCTITWTGRVVKEPIPRHFELFEYVGTDELGQPIKVYVYRVEKIEKDKEQLQNTPI